MYHTQKQKEKGFTLIELIVYIAIISVVGISFVGLSLSVISARNKTQVTQEIHAHMQFVLGRMTDRIRSASGVTIGSSTFGSDPGKLVLSMSQPSLDPTYFQLDANDGRLQLIENGTITYLTPATIQVTNLVFTNMTGSSSHENIQIDITMMYTDGGSGQGFSATQSAQTSVSLRQ